MPYYEVVFNKPLPSYVYFSEIENLIHRRVSVSLGKENRQLSLVGKKNSIVGFVIRQKKKEQGIEYKSIISVLDEQEILTKKDIALAEWLSNYYLCFLGEAISLFISFSSISQTKNKATNKKKKSIKEIEKKPLIQENFERIDLNKEQQETVKNIISSKNSFHYVHGVTGSGKTFVYLKIIAFLLKKNKSVIFLVPEINLIEQNLILLQKYFGDKVGVYHGSLTFLQKEKIKKEFRQGNINIIIGTRSCFFLNSANLELIIIDEEHESSYKNDSTPRYQIKTLAQQKAKIQNLKIVFGSATPSIEVFYHTKKKIDYYFLGQRFYDAPLPSIEIVKSSNKKIFDEEVISKISTVLQKKGQVLVFYNQRGFAKSVFCRDCQVVLSCPNCSLTLHYHKFKNKLLCHYCDYQFFFRSKCMNCRKDNLSYIGTGIEKVTEELQKKFLMHQIDRLDSDSASSYKKVSNLLEKIKKKEIDIIVGTQMICKGHHFPNVNLVIVLHPENILNIPDFRSSERFFSQIVQVAGRSGRTEQGGEVVIQTFIPNHSMIELGKNHDYHNFYYREINFRHQFNYPPFVKMIRITARGKKENEVKEVIQKVFEKIKFVYQNHQKEENEIFLYPPSSCLIQKINLNYRWHILMKSKNINLMIQILTTIKQQKFNNVYLEYDVDPTELF